MIEFLIHSLLGLALLWGSGPGLDRAHPQDGPDVDLRVRVDRDRVEIQAIVNLAFIVDLIPELGLDLGANFAQSKDLPLLRQRLETLMREGVRIAGSEGAIPPDRLGIEEMPWEPEDAEFFPRMGLRAVQKFRVDMHYRLTEPPRQIGLVWRLYPRDLALADLVEQKLNVNAEWSAGRDVRIVEFTEAEPEYVWHAPIGAFERPERPGKVAAVKNRRRTIGVDALVIVLLAALGLLVPACGAARPRRASILSGLLAGTTTGIALLLGTAAARESKPPALDDAQAINLFQERLRGIYDAFSFTAESDIYDALAACVSDRLIDSTYDEVYQSLVMREEGGAVGRVRTLTPRRIDVVERSADGRAILIDARWQVEGEVYHWGHTHTRRNEYHARHGLAFTDRGWLIDHSEAISQQRLDPRPAETPR